MKCYHEDSSTYSSSDGPSIPGSAELDFVTQMSCSLVFYWFFPIPTCILSFYHQHQLISAPNTIKIIHFSAVPTNVLSQSSVTQTPMCNQSLRNVFFQNLSNPFQSGSNNFSNHALFYHFVGYQSLDYLKGVFDDCLKKLRAIRKRCKDDSNYNWPNTETVTITLKSLPVAYLHV